MLYVYIRDVLGAAFCQPLNRGAPEEAFVPLVVTACNGYEPDNVLIEISSLSKAASIDIGDVIASVVLDLNKVRGVEFVSPTLAMGPRPEVICCCASNTIVAAVRRKGVVAVYKFNGISLELAKLLTVDHFIVDAAVRSKDETDCEVVLLLCDKQSTKDGRVFSFVA